MMWQMKVKTLNSVERISVIMNANASFLQIQIISSTGIENAALLVKQ